MLGMFMMVLILAGAGLLVIGGLRWIDRRSAPLEGRGVPPETVARLESALGSLEARVDALQEQQQFLERLLADRPGRGALPPGDEPTAEDVKSILFDVDRDAEEDG